MLMLVLKIDSINIVELINTNVAQPAPIPNNTSCFFVNLYSIAFAEKIPVQKTMVNGLDIVSKKQLMKLVTGVHCVALLSIDNELNTLFKIIKLKRISTNELIIPTINFILSFSIILLKPNNDKAI